MEWLSRFLGVHIHIRRILRKSEARFRNLLFSQLAWAGNLHLNVLALLLLLRLAGMDLSHEGSHPLVFVVVVHEHLSSLIIQAALCERVDQKTTDHFEDCSDVPGFRIPVSLQSIDANLAFERDIGVEDFGREVTYRS